MNTRLAVLLTGLSSFAGGFILGLLVAPESGREARQRVSLAAHGSTRWMGDRLQELEGRLHEIEAQVQETGLHLSQRVREATGRTLDAYVPSVPNEDAWDIRREDLSRNLRRMPRR